MHIWPCLTTLPTKKVSVLLIQFSITVQLFVTVLKTRGWDNWDLMLLQIFSLIIIFKVDSCNSTIFLRHFLGSKLCNVRLRCVGSNCRRRGDEWSAEEIVYLISFSHKKNLMWILHESYYRKDKLNHLVSLSMSYIVKRYILFGRGNEKWKLCKSDAKWSGFR